MVAISVYRGNLHRVSDAPRRWPVPSPRISLKDFKSLIARRSKALSRLRPPETTAAKVAEEPPQQHQLKLENVSNHEAVKDGDDRTMHVDGFDALSDKDQGFNEIEPPVMVVESENPNSEARKNTDALNDKAKRKREVEEKLEILNAQKHSLVQVLKQILNAEEELKRRNNMQAIRPSVSLQVDARMGSEANLGGDLEGGDDVSNQNVQPRHLLRMSSTSPSSESPLRRPVFSQLNSVPHPSRTNLVVSSSPSRFAPPGHPAHPANPPTVSVSVSVTNYIASSPSPAASGGTSVFREARLPSPWN